MTDENLKWIEYTWSVHNIIYDLPAYLSISRHYDNKLFGFKFGKAGYGFDVLISRADLVVIRDRINQVLGEE